jgi:ATP-dependent RNA helicase SUPV3L1/SUV3
MAQIRTVTAVLGPTNTGKTHLAVERMLAHGGGMIGLPLRLLAREIYDRVRRTVGDRAVALVTGEEKIIPASPRYWVATVEAMPPEVMVPFLAIDEIQLCADFERGHIFTDRVLHRRGTEETMLLGAATMKPILEQMLPRTTFVSRPRFSKLSYAGVKKMSRLPRRSAIVAFSAEMVYSVAELIRRQNGGAAVVLGALSPRTRNAQVALFQSGDVDYIVATDAIGMGLNMNVDHVAFAATRKFDGFQYRELNAGELGQVAGRAGRFMNDGTFGCTGEAEGFDPEMVERLENHRFDSIRALQWRNPDLDFRSLEHLHRSLSAFPRQPGLTRAQPGPDLEAFEAVSRDAAIAPTITSPRQVDLLWSCCQIPDYRNISPAEHAHLVGHVFRQLSGPRGHIDEDWFARQLRHCENLEGDIDTLSNRISHVRTWTFIANRSNWLKAPAFWQHRAREIEEKLSDALHQRLTQRFIDRRTSVLMRRLAQKEELMSSVQEDGAVHVEGEYVGRIKGFNFIPDGASESPEQRTLKAAAVQAVATEMAARAVAAATSADPDLKLTRDGNIIWNHEVIGTLEAGEAPLKPRARVLASDLLTGQPREDVQNRLQKFVDRHVAAVLEPLLKLQDSESFQGLARGIAFRLVEGFGVLPREQVAEDVKSLSQEDRAALRAQGVRFGSFHIFTPLLLKPAATDLRLLLWALQVKKAGGLDLANLPQPPGQGLTSAAFDRSTPVGFYGVCGFRICGTRVVRIDMLERLADLIRDRVFWRPRFPEEARPAGSVEGGGFTVVADMMSLVGCSGEEFQGILRSLGFRMQKKKVKRPVTPAPATPRADAAADAAAPVAAADTSTPADPAIVALPEPDPAGPVEPVAPVVTAEAATEVVVPAPEMPPLPAPAPAEPTAAALEEVELEVWWPKDTGPFRHRAEPRERPRHPAADAQAPNASPDAQGPRPARQRFGKPAHKGHHNERGERHDPAERQERPQKAPRPEPKPRNERPIDPNSPFAVLSALKAQMTGSKT